VCVVGSSPISGSMNNKSQFKQLEIKVLAYRYLYYVKSISKISDLEYDKLEKLACCVLPDDSDVHKCGSDIESSYSREVVEFANEIC